MFLKKLSQSWALILLIAVGNGELVAKEKGPIYSSEETKRVVEAMINAHGGLEKWQQFEAISFDNVMHNNYHQKSEFAWWVAHETIDKKSRKVYQEWPYDGASIGYDGNVVWANNWRRANLPPFMVHFFYYFVNLPWLTQDNNVELSDVSTFQWPGQEKHFYEIRMTFKHAPGVGKSDNDYFVLYIDPDSYLLRGYQYAVGYKPQLAVMNMPPEREVFGPMWRLITSYSNVEGLVFPSAFRTMPEPDERIVGNHVIMNITLDNSFDESKAQAPKDAQIYSGSSFSKVETITKLSAEKE